jgi:hemoglobin
MSNAARREPHPAAAGLAVGIDEALVRAVVETFYAKVRRDPLLGPIFNEAVADWPEHLDRLCAFWSSLTLMTGRYKGDPFGVHLALPPLGPAHFRTWLGLFEETLAALCTPDQAEVFRVRAERVAESLKLGLAIRRGEAPLPTRRSASSSRP